MEIIDFRRGQYRRIYSGAKYGRRINSVSDFAARLLAWGIIPNTDDWGNLSASPVIVKAECFPLLQSATVENIDGALRELADIRLISLYDLPGEMFLHVHGHTQLQPASANGRRVRRWPPSPWDFECALDPGDESDGIRGNPGESGGTRKSPENPARNKNKNKNNNSSSRAGAGACARTSESDPKSEPIAAAAAAAAAAAEEKGERGGADCVQTDGRYELASSLGIRDIPSGNSQEIISALRAIKARVDAGENVRNPAGLLRRMLADGFSPPATKRRPRSESAADYAARMAERAASERNAILAARAAEAELGPIGSQLRMSTRMKNENRRAFTEGR